MIKNKHGQTPQEVTRANVLQQLRFMATNESGYAELSLYNENTSSFLKEVRKHYAKINNTLETIESNLAATDRKASRSHERVDIIAEKVTKLEVKVEQLQQGAAVH